MNYDTEPRTALLPLIPGNVIEARQIQTEMRAFEKRQFARVFNDTSPSKSSPWFLGDYSVSYQDCIGGIMRH
jgi:hypothetical protein